MFRGPGSEHTHLNAITTHGTSGTWAVGMRPVGEHDVAVRERWNGHVWTR